MILVQTDSGSAIGSEFGGGAPFRLFLGNEESGQKCAILYTILENCRRLCINPKDYLTDVLTRLPGVLARDAIPLTPPKDLVLDFRVNFNDPRPLSQGG